MTAAELEALCALCLQALVAHDPAKVPLAPDARYTENTVELAFGRGLWRTLSSAEGAWRIVAADPLEHQCLFMGVVEENGAPAILVLRLREADGQVTELEALVVRDPRGTRQMGELDPVFLDIVPAERRLPREAMIALVERYFDAVETCDPEDLQFHPGCFRRENGEQSTDNPGRTEDFFTPGFHGYALDCKTQIGTGMWSFIEKIGPRRYVVVDEARGLVLGLFTFMHPGVVTSFIAPSGDVVPTPPYSQYPSTFEIAEIFKFDAGAFRRIEAIGIILPYGTKSGW